MLFLEILKKHIETYSEATLVDLYKLMYQSEFGGGHIVVDLEAHYDFLVRELFETKDLPYKGTEIIDQDVYRLYLDGLYGKLSPKTIQDMIILSSNKKQGNIENLCLKMELLKEVVKDQSPLKFISDIKESNFPIYSHSKTYKALYNPHYRIIHKHFAHYIELFIAIDTHLKKNEDLVIAIDGMTTSGKTYLADLIQSIYHSNTIHVDDFFLQEHQKTEERLSEVGGNLDYERFEDEVLTHLKDESFSYRPYDCQTKALLEPIIINKHQITVIEGSYSLKAPFRKYYDLLIYLELGEHTQKERLSIRNPKMLDNFVKMWMPKENQYAKQENIRHFADFVIDTTTLFDMDNIRKKI